MKNFAANYSEVKMVFSTVNCKFVSAVVTEKNQCVLVNVRLYLSVLKQDPPDGTGDSSLLLQIL